MQGINIAQAIAGAKEITNGTQQIQPQPSNLGMIIKTPEKVEEGVVIGQVPDEVNQRINSYFSEEEEAILEKVKRENNGVLPVEEKAITDTLVKVDPTLQVQVEKQEEPEIVEESKSLQEKYDEVSVIIDKTGIGTIINFTDEERAKLEKSQVIKLQEVENVNLQVLKTKKLIEKGKLKSMIKKKVTKYSTNVAASASGYMATMRSSSTTQLLELLMSQNTQSSPAEMLRLKWSIIYDSIAEFSVSEKVSFDQFLHMTSQLDYNMFVFGLITATYGTKPQIIPLNCHQEAHGEKGIEFDQQFEMAELLRLERMSDRLRDMLGNTIESATVLENAKAWQQNHAPIMQVKKIKLPDSEIIVEIQLESVYDFINNSSNPIEDIAGKSHVKAQFAQLCRHIRSFNIPDEDGQYFSITSMEEKIEVICELMDSDVAILTKKINELTEGLEMDFGLMNVKCPKCGNITEFIPFNLEQILFTIVGQSTSKQVE